MEAGTVGEDLSAVALFQIVCEYGRIISKTELVPHDLRAQIGYESSVPITQIGKLLGHSSVAATQTIMNLDLETTISDFVPALGE